MTHHTERRLFPWTQQQLYELVADIEHYPDFLPWCLGVQVNSRSGNIANSQMTIGYRVFRETVKTRVIFSPYESITVQYIDGPLESLENLWRFTPTNLGCELFFEVELKFKSRSLGLLMEVFFDKACRKMVHAFEERAKVLYGSLDNNRII